MKKETYIIKPRVTEKAMISTDKNKYIFLVSQNANKDNLRQEVKLTYKVSPIKINIVNTQPRNVLRRGRPGRVSGFKKAILTLKKGDKIDIA
ncbi:MAG: 50S ribosomal protein L23 [Patescibacteria group bacterium]